MKHEHNESHCHDHSCGCHACKAVHDSCCDSASKESCRDGCLDSDSGDPDHQHGCGCGCSHEHGEEAPAPFDRAALIAGGVLAAASLLPLWGGSAWLLMAAAVLAVGYPLFLEGIRSILTGHSFDELGLLTVAVAASLGLAATSSAPFEGAVEAMAVTALFRLGEYLEGRAIAKSQRDIEALTNIRPDTALLLSPDGAQRAVPAEEVTIGSTILLKAGDRVPIDCEVTTGSGYVDFSAITGEPIPVSASAGSRLMSGAINTDGLLTCVTTASFEDSAASRIIKLVRESAEQKGQAEKLISRFSKVYTPAVVLMAAMLAVLPPLFGFGPFGMWLSRALVFLVASCPCALVISVPLTFFAGVGLASRSGILIKGTRYLETLANADCVVFDKTGTLTRGVPAVEKMLCAKNSLPRETLLSLAASAERNSSHPAARAVCEYSGGAPLMPVAELTEFGGKGVSLKCGEYSVLCGSYRLMEQFGVSYLELGEANIYLAVNGSVQCAFVLNDTLREDAAEAAIALRKAGVKTLAMLTGDSAAAAQRVSDALGLDAAFAQLLPEQKAQRLSEIRASHRATVFVGDGINDAPVLTGADVGAAMGLGTDTAIEAADIVLVNERLSSLPKAIGIARRTVGKARQNIIFALAVKAVVLTLGAFGCAAMWMAVFADVGVSILAVLNSLTLLTDKSV